MDGQCPHCSRPLCLEPRLFQGGALTLGELSVLLEILLATIRSTQPTQLMPVLDSELAKEVCTLIWAPPDDTQEEPEPIYLVPREDYNEYLEWSSTKSKRSDPCLLGEAAHPGPGSE